MKRPSQDLKEYYESLETEDLVERYKQAGIRGFDRAILAQILRERGISPEKIPKSSYKEKEADEAKEDVPPSSSDLKYYIKHYESFDTKTLLKYRQKNILSKFAFSVVTQILKDRGVSNEKLNNQIFEERPSENSSASMKLPSKESEKAAFLKLLNQSNPRFFITKIIIALNLFIFIVMAISGVSLFSPQIEDLIKWGANFGPFTVNHWWRLVSSNFLHFGIIHLLFNMLCLWHFGKFAERMFGSGTFLMLYVMSGLGGSVASLWWHPMLVSVGASGAVFGIAGGMIAFLYLGKLRVPKEVIRKNIRTVLFFVGFNVSFGFTLDFINNAAHLGGLFVGLVIGAFFHRPLPPPPKEYSHLPIRHYIVLSALSLSLILAAHIIKQEVGENPLARIVKAENLISLGKFEKAISVCSKTIEIDQEFSPAYNMRGIAYSNKGEFDEAISDYNKAIVINPNYAEPYCNRGLAYLKERQYDLAIADCEKAIEINPKLSEAYNNRGIAYFFKKEYDKAWDDVHNAQSLGCQVHPSFLKDLREASGRQK